jgi:peptide/nickel transport system substrate-binding protein
MPAKILTFLLSSKRSNCSILYCEINDDQLTPQAVAQLSKARPESSEGLAHCPSPKIESWATYHDLFYNMIRNSLPVCLIAYLLICLMTCLPALGQITFRYGELEQPNTFEPTTATKMVERRLCQLTFEGLLEEVYDPKRKRKTYKRVLATRHAPSADGLSYQFDLHSDIKAADGSPVDSRDVLHTIRLITHQETELFDPMRAVYLDGGSSRPLNPKKIRIQFHHLFYDANKLLTFKVIPRGMGGHRQAFLTRTSAFAQNPIGTGPYVYNPDKGKRRIYLFEKNPYYEERENKRGKPYMEQIEMETYRDLGTMLAQFENGDLDLVTETSPLAVERYQRSTDIQLASYNSRTIYFLAYNQRINSSNNPARQALAEADFRKAMTYMLDRDEVLRTFYRSGSQAHVTISGPFPKNTPLYNDSVEGYAHDPDKAGRLFTKVLRKLGYEKDESDGYWKRGGNRFSLTLKYVSAGDEIDRVTEELRDKAADHGVEIRLEKQPVESIWYSQVYNAHDFDIVFHSYSLGPTLNIRPLFDSRMTGEGESNFAGYIDAEIDQAVSEIYHTTDPGAMQTLAYRAHQLIHEKCVFTFLWQLDKQAAFQESLQNVVIHPYYLFNNIEDWKK